MSRLSRSTSLAVPPSPSPSSSSVCCLPFFTRSQTPLGRLFGICLASGCVSLKCSTCHLVLHKRQTEGGGKWDFLFLWLSLSQSGSLSLCFFASLSLSQRSVKRVTTAAVCDLGSSLWLQLQLKRSSAPYPCTLSPFLFLLWHAWHAACAIWISILKATTPRADQTLSWDWTRVI